MVKNSNQHAADFNIRDPVFNDPNSVYEVYDVMREKCPFSHASSQPLRKSGTAWWSTRYEESFQILKDWEHFSNERPEVSEVPDILVGSIIATDPPNQQQMRRILNPYFTPAYISALETPIRDTATQLIDNFIDSGFGDLAQDVAWKLPGITLFKDLLGMPVDVAYECLELAEVPNQENPSDEERALAASSLVGKVDDLIKARMGQPRRDDVVDVLISAELDGERLPFEQILANAVLLIIAGLETTSKALSVAYYFLGTHSEERDRLAQDPSLIPAAIEEFVRYSGSVHGLPRTVTKRIVISGHEFSPGDHVEVNYAAANRDPREFSEPDRCVLDRVTNRHLGFSAGAHRCLGANLARLQMKVALEEVLRRMPDYQVDDASNVRFQGAALTRGYMELPVVFTQTNQSSGV
jgi:cytochrome P450